MDDSNIGEDGKNNWRPSFRVVYDFFYLFLEVILVANIIGALIIDTFLVLRHQHNKRNIDMTDYCFMCGIDRSTFDKNSN